MNLTSFLIASIIIILLPGTGVIYTIATAMTYGKKQSILAACGCTLGILPHLCLSIALSTLFLKINQTIFTVVQYLGVIYLIYLAINLLRSNPPSLEAASNPPLSLHILRQGIIINLLNPKLTLFCFSFLPQYVSTTSNHYVMKSFFFGLLFMAITLIVFIGYGILANTIKRLFLHSAFQMKLVHKLLGICFLAFAVKLLL